MAENSEPTNVRVAVQRQPTDSEADSSLRSGPRIQSPEYNVVVPVTSTLLDSNSGINVRRFLRTAVALAADNDGRVLLLGVETVSDETTLETLREHVRTEQPPDTDVEDAIETVEERRTQLARIVDVAQQLDPSVTVRAVVRAVTDITNGILDIVDGEHETAILLSRGYGLDEGWLFNRSTIDAVLADADCDVFVENMGTEGGENTLYVPNVDEHTVASLAESEAETIDSILLPVGMGAHAALAAEAARAVARAADAAVTVLHVVPPDAPAEAKAEGTDLLKFAEYVLGPELQTDTELREAADTTEAIVREAKAHDFISIGFPEEKSRLAQLVFESVQQTLSETDEATVLMARDADRTMRSLYYRWKRGIEAIEDDSASED